MEVEATRGDRAWSDAMFRRMHAAKGKERAAIREEIILANLWVVAAESRRFRRSVNVPHILVPDLSGAGSVGLVRAVDGFDPSRPVAFSTYAGRSVRRELQNLVDTFRSPLTVPPQALQSGRKLARGGARDAYANHVPAARAALRAAVPFDARIDGPVDDPEAAAAAEELSEQRAKLDALVRGLPRRDRVIITGLYGLAGWVAQSTREVGRQIGLSHQSVSQIERAALAAMRRGPEGVRAYRKAQEPIPRPPKRDMRRSEWRRSRPCSAG